MAARHEEERYTTNTKHVFKCVPVCKGLSNDDVGVATGTVLQEIRPGAGFKTDDFVKENLGGLPQNDAKVIAPSVALVKLGDGMVTLFR